MEWEQKFEAMKIEAANTEFKLRSEVKYLTAKLNTVGDRKMIFCLTSIFVNFLVIVKFSEFEWE